MRAAAHLSAHEAGVLERLDVLRRRRERHRVRRGELADRLLVARERAQHVPARRVAERVEDRVQPGLVSFNHVVENRPCFRKCQPFG